MKPPLNPLIQQVLLFQPKNQQFDKRHRAGLKPTFRLDLIPHNQDTKTKVNL